jgi:hypothetical protein
LIKPVFIIYLSTFYTGFKYTIYAYSSEENKYEITKKERIIKAFRKYRRL